MVWSQQEEVRVVGCCDNNTTQFHLIKEHVQVTTKAFCYWPAESAWNTEATIKENHLVDLLSAWIQIRLIGHSKRVIAHYQ